MDSQRRGAAKERLFVNDSGIHVDRVVEDTLGHAEAHLYKVLSLDGDLSIAESRAALRLYVVDFWLLVVQEFNSLGDLIIFFFGAQYNDLEILLAWVLPLRRYALDLGSAYKLCWNILVSIVSKDALNLFSLLELVAKNDDLGSSVGWAL